MSPLFLLVGLPSSGKIALTRRLEAKYSALCGEGELGSQRGVLAAHLLWPVAARSLQLGVSTLLHYGLWTREERQLLRARVALGVRCELRVLDAPLEALWRRLASRNLNKSAATFTVSRPEREAWAGWYQVPTPDELNATDVPAFPSTVWSLQP